MLSIDLPDLAQMQGCEKEYRTVEPFTEELNKTRSAFMQKNLKGVKEGLKPIFKELVEQTSGPQQNLSFNWMRKLNEFIQYYMFQHQTPDYSVLPKGYKTYTTDAPEHYRPNLEHYIKELQNMPDDNRALQLGIYDRGMDVETNPIQNSFESLGIIKLASAFLKRTVKVDRAFLHVARFTDKNPYQFFQDNPNKPYWTNTHFDPKENTVKAIVYLNDIRHEDGAFKYIPYSNQYKRDSLQNVFSRAISTGSYCHTPDSRASVFALPPQLRVSANFGRLAREGSFMDNWLTQGMKTFVPSEGDNIVVFDPNGLHQGGIVRYEDGERICLQVLMR